MDSMERELRFTLTYGPADQGHYLRLPFDVPPDTDRVEVEYAYARFVTEDVPDGRRQREQLVVGLVEIAVQLLQRALVDHRLTPG